MYLIQRGAFQGPDHRRGPSSGPALRQTSQPAESWLPSYSFTGPLRIDFRILALTGGLVGFAALLFGSVPAFLLAKIDACEALKDRVAHASSRRSRHFRSGLVVGEIALALTLLSGAGLLVQSLMAYSVSERTAVIAIRMALGAESSDVLSLFLKRGVRLLVTGLLVGLLGSVMMAALLRNQLYGVSATDLPTLAGISVLLASITLLACWLPARRAAQVDPLAALKRE